MRHGNERFPYRLEPANELRIHVPTAFF